MKHKHLLFLTMLLVTTSFSFSGCTKPEDKANDNEIQLNFNKQNNDKVQLTDTKVVSNNKKAKPSMIYKTIKDFKNIEANQVVIETTKGELVLELFRDKAPLTTANFLDLVDQGFYDGIIFHRVIPGFMAQFGDPNTKDPSIDQSLWGTGGPEYRIMDEFSDDLKHDQAGILSMANAGPNTGGSQVFITYEATPHLDGKHAVFGKLIKGMNVLESITKGDKIIKASYR